MCRPPGHTHQGGEALRAVEQLVARTGEDDQPPIENDHLGRKIERDAGMLLTSNKASSVSCRGKSGLAVNPGDGPQLANTLRCSVEPSTKLSQLVRARLLSSFGRRYRSQ
jgi:hypothetical protein